MLSTSDILITAVFTALVLCSIIGNSFVIAVVIRKRKMKTPVNFLIANLAVSDAVFSAFLIPWFILIHSFHHPHGVPGDLLCKIMTGGNLTWTGGVASVFTLVAIASERFHAIVHPHKRKQRMTKTKAKGVIAICWIMSFLLNTPLFFVVTYSEEKDYCVESWWDTDLSKAYSMGWFIFVGLIPFGFMVNAYTRVMLTLWRRTNGTNNTQQVLLRSRNKITKIVFLVTLIYAFTWFPCLFYYAIAACLGDNIELGSIFDTINLILTAINAASNPCIYAFQSKNFRDGVRDLLHLRRSNKIMTSAEAFRLQTLSPGAGCKPG